MNYIESVYNKWKKIYKFYIEGNNIIPLDLFYGKSENLLYIEDFLELQYVFPLIDIMYKKGKISNKCPLIINIIYDPDSANADIIRTIIFLLFVKEESHFTFNLDGKSLIDWKKEVCKSEELLKRVKPGNIFPVMKITKITDNDLTSFLDLKRPFNRVYTNSEGMVKNFDDAVNILIDNLREKDIFHGDKNNPLNSNQKKELRKIVIDAIEQWMPEMDRLSFVIWLILLHETTITKQLFNYVSDSKKILKDVLIKTRMDAVFYGEAAYQLIENACIHSQEGIAWIGFRVHNFYKGRYDKEKIKYLEERYPHSKNSSSTFSDTNDIFIELFVLDGSENNKGMIETFNDNPSNYERKIQSIEELFDLKIREQHEIEDTTVHYGLRLMKNILFVNDGRLNCISSLPNKGTIYYDCDKCIKLDDEYQTHLTCFQLLFPVQYKIQEKIELNTENLKIKEDFSNPRRKMNYLSVKKFAFSNIENDFLLSQKNKDIDECRDTLSIFFEGDKKDDFYMNNIFVLNMPNDAYSLEIISKALFSEIWKLDINKDIKEYEDGYSGLVMALLFQGMDYLYEFLRLYSIFYIKGQNIRMRNVQIALCIKDNGRYNIETILCGQKLLSTFLIARHFAYNHPKYELEYLPIISYLASSYIINESEKIIFNNPIYVYPFDLYMPPEFPDKSENNIDINYFWNNNLFISNLKDSILEDLQNTSYGICVQNTHFRLSSRIHLNKFYEAELLFHDYGNIYRFAHIIASEIIRRDSVVEDNDRIILLGYEKYSVSLLIQIKKILETEMKLLRIETAVVYDSSYEGKPNLELFFGDEFLSCNNLKIITILPVGSTLSTIYKIHNVTRNRLKNKILINNEMFVKNYCIILVGNTGNNSDEIRNRFWDGNVNLETQEVTVCEEKHSSFRPKVKYLIMAEAEWYDPEECKLCKIQKGTIRPIFDVKKSELLPNAIFLMKDKRTGTFNDFFNGKTNTDIQNKKEENRKKIQSLYGKVVYSHTFNENDHFQFYIDFNKFYLENEREIISWLDDVNQIENDAINIIISPQKIENSNFVNAVLDKIFHGGAFFLHFDIQDAYKEEVRTKFNYISEYIQNLMADRMKTKLKIHFVDNSIISGNLINRAWQLIRMLLTQANMDIDMPNGFDKVILLINRSSYDTIQSYVPVQDSLIAYMHLAVPSYNMERDTCPACSLATKYKLLKKRSSTEYLSSEFMRLEKKHKKQLISKYYDSIDEDILSSPSYFSWLRQWLGLQNLSDGSNLRVYSEEKMEDNYSNKQDYNLACKLHKQINDFLSNWLLLNCTEQNDNAYDKIQNVLSKISKLSIVDVFDDSSMYPDIIDMVKRYMIGVRDYMRLYCMQTAYENLTEDCDVVKVISDGLNKTVKNDTFDVVSDCEWIISYFKVYSREHLANYYSIRVKIVNIMYEVYLMLMSNPNDCETNIFKLSTGKEGKRIVRPIKQIMLELKKTKTKTDKKTEIYSYMRYQMCTMIFHRLSDLQVNRIVNKNNIDAYINMYIYGLKCFEYNREEKEIYFPIINYPSENTAIIRYLKSIKTAIMTSHDDISCIQLERFVSAEIRKYTNIIYDNMEQNDIALRIFLSCYIENTRLFYSGMSQISRMLHGDIEKIESKYRYSEKYNYMIKDLREIINKELEDCYKVGDSFKETDILYQNILGNLCRFWHIGSNVSPVRDDKFAYMFRYFRNLQVLSEVKNYNVNKDDIPYIYEDICRSIIGFTEYKMCYIVCDNESIIPELIMQSGYYIPFVQNNKIMTPNMAGEIIQHLKNNRLDNLKQNKENYIKNLFHNNLFQYCDNQIEYICVKLSSNNGDYSFKNNNNADFYVILQKERSNDEELYGSVSYKKLMQLADIARNILFVREMLVEVLTRDYILLGNRRFDHSYIRTLEKKSFNDVKPSILHISDLHIIEDTTTYEIKIEKKIKEKLSKSSKNIDLLLVSGDIVDAKDASAPAMKEKYAFAKKLLFNIAAELWQDNDCYLSHDWKKRIVISTGNHDYASMNQYKSSLYNRNLGPGIPIDKDSGTMSKFAYFIDFLIDFLDAPIDLLLPYDLNEVRDYRNLNIKILNLNCSGQATPNRTNKLGVNKKCVEELIRQSKWIDDRPVIKKNNSEIINIKPFRICLMHYSPDYKLSYFIDKFQDNIPGWEWENGSQAPINKLVNTYFIDAIKSEMTYRMMYIYTGFVWGSLAEKTKIQKENENTHEESLLLKEFRGLNVALDAIEKGKIISASDIISDKYFKYLKKSICNNSNEKAFVKKMKKNTLYNRIREYCEWIEKPNRDRSDEKINELVSDIYNCFVMSQFDMEKFKDFIAEIDKNNKIDLFLTGHVHAYGESTYNDGNSKILVSDKLFYKNDDVLIDEFKGYVINEIQGKVEKKSKIASFKYYRLDNENDS